MIFESLSWDFPFHGKLKQNWVSCLKEMFSCQCHISLYYKSNNSFPINEVFDNMNKLHMVMMSHIWLKTVLMIVDVCSNLHIMRHPQRAQLLQSSYSRMLPFLLLFPKMTPATLMKFSNTVCFRKTNYVSFHIKKYVV